MNTFPQIKTVLSYHPYRTFYPWEHGGKKVFYRPYVTGDDADQLAHWLADQMGNHNDNHHGWLVESTDGNKYFVRFSDWTISFWLMP